MRRQPAPNVGLEFATLEREVYIEASPTVVYDVVSSPEHVRQWWPDEADFEPVPRTGGCIAFVGEDGGRVVQGLTVVAAEPPHRFSFRWTHLPEEDATEGNSLLVVFDLIPSGSGTLLKLTESGFREMGWEAARLQEEYAGHVTGWDHFLPQLVAYAATLDGRS